MDYKQKYLKYKKKYLELKKTQGKYLGLGLPHEIELHIIAQSSDEEQLWRFGDLGLRALNRYDGSGVYEIFGDLKGPMNINRVLAVNTVNPLDPNPVQYRLMDVFRIRHLVIENNEQFALFNEYIQNNDIEPSEIGIRNRFLRDIRILTIGNGFNQPLGDSLNMLTGLNDLRLGSNFNQPLGNSLNMLTNLQILTFGSNFNQPLGDSLNMLTNLKSLIFDTKFDQHLGDSLNNLTNLQALVILGDFDKPLGNSLNNLTNLQHLLLIGKFNQPLGNSLNNLRRLQTLFFGMDFNQPLGNSLVNLTDLQKLRIPDSYEYILNEHLTSIRI